MINFETCWIWNQQRFTPTDSKSEFDRLFPLHQVNGFVTFQDENQKQGWVNKHGEQIGALHTVVYDFKNKHARFYDRINNNAKYGWVNEQGEQIGQLHYLTYNFENNHAQFVDTINGERKEGYINYLGLEMYAELKTCEKALKLILKDFPKDSLKLFILEEICSM